MDDDLEDILEVDEYSNDDDIDLDELNSEEINN